MIKAKSKVLLFFLLFVLLTVISFTDYELEPRLNRNHRIIKTLDSLPLYFVENRGQENKYVKYLLKIPNGKVYYTPKEIVYQFFHWRRNNPEEMRAMGWEKENSQQVKVEDIRVKFLGVKKNVKIKGLEKSEAKFNYFRGNDPLKWVKGTRTYERILYKDLYPHIDLIVYGSGGRIKHEYWVSAGGEVEKIELRYEGIKQLRVNERGQLEIETGEGVLREDAPFSYQIIDGERVKVETRYVIDKDNTLRYKVGKYRKDKELIIDPTLIYSTYLGGSIWEDGYGIAIDGSGNAYITGNTYSSDFPTPPGAYDTSYNGGSWDAFITKINSAGTDLLYSTYLGGSNDDYGSGIAVDGNGNAYITGMTDSGDFPTTPNAYDTTYNGYADAFITKIDSTGTNLIYSTYLGGSNSNDWGFEIAIDGSGNAYITGYTYSLDFPTTPGAYDTSYNGYADAFITKIDSTGTNLIYSTYLGGSNSNDWGFEIAIDGSGNAYITGYTYSLDFPTTPGAYDTSYNGGYGDAFITKIDSTGTNLIYSTYLGGNDSDWGLGLVIDENGAVYVTGWAGSSDFPTTLGAYDTSHNGDNDVFITKIDSTGTGLLYSTYLGGDGEDAGYGIAIDGSDNAYITGYTYSSDFPTIPGAYDTSHNGNSDAFITKINSTGTNLIYSTYLGGSDSESIYGDYPDIVVDINSNAYITGKTMSSDFPITSGAYDTTYNGYADAFITKINFEGTDLLYSTYLGGSGGDYGYGIAVDGDGDAYVVGSTDSGDFPTIPSAYDTRFNGGIDVFITKIPTLCDLSISITTGGTTDPEPGTYTYDSGTEVIIEAIPEIGYRFSGWSGDASGTTNPITITMDSDKSIKANFSAIAPPEEGKKGGCFIATAAYGSPLHFYVRILQDFRDIFLVSNKLGRKLVDLYYKYSPFAAELITKHKALKAAVRIHLLPLVAFSYSMLHFGPMVTGVILVIILMLPVFLISFFRRKLKRVEAKDLKVLASRF